MIRPGPPALAPGECPGGVVIRVYTTGGRLLVETLLDDAEAAEYAAGRDADRAGSMLARGEAPVLVAYDGDTGRRYGRDELVALLRGPG